MKYIVLLFLVGFASSASLYGGLDEAADELVRDFMVGLENAESLKDALDFDAVYAEDGDDDDGTQTELGKKLKEALEQVVEKIKEAIDHGKTVKEDLLEKLKEIREQMKEHKVKIGEKAKELIEKLKGKLKDYWQKILDIFGGKKDDERDVAFVDWNILERLRELKKKILEKFDKERLKEIIEKLFERKSEIAEMLLNILKEKGEKVKEKILDFLDRILGDKEDEVERRSIKELWEKVKDYFEKAKLEIKERFVKFGEWVKETMKGKLVDLKEKTDKLKKIAEEVIGHGKDLTKDVAAEALEFFRPYKEDLGALWDQLKNTVKDVFNRED